jgi:hypothetical protein
MAPLPRFSRTYPAGAALGPLSRLEDEVARFANAVTRLLDGGLTFAEHMKGAEVVGTITVPAGAPWATADRPQLRLPKEFTGSPRLVVVADAKQDGSTEHYGAPPCTWSRVTDGDRQAISFHSITGLSAGEWTITIQVSP